MKMPEITYGRLPATEKPALIKYYVSSFTGVYDDFTEDHISGAEAYTIEADGERAGTFGISGGARLSM